MAGFECDAKDISTVALNALWNETDRRRDAIDAARIQVRPNRARTDDVVTVGGQPAFERFIGFVRECEDHPVRIGARSGRSHRHAARNAIGTCCRLNLQAVATPFVSFAESCDFDALLFGRNDDGC